MVLLADAKIANALTTALACMAVAIAAIAGFYLTRAIKRWMAREAPAEPFTLQDIREMKARGEIDEREFQAMRAAILGAAASKPSKRTAAAKLEEPDHPA